MSGINFNRDKIPDLKKYLPTFEEAEFYKKIQREYKKQTEEQSLFPGDDGRSRSEKGKKFNRKVNKNLKKNRKKMKKSSKIVIFRFF